MHTVHQNTSKHIHYNLPLSLKSVCFMLLCLFYFFTVFLYNSVRLLEYIYHLFVEYVVILYYKEF